MPPESADGFGAVYEGYLVEVEILAPEFFQGEFLVDGEGCDEFMMQELGGAEEEGEELVVV